MWNNVDSRLSSILSIAPTVSFWHSYVISFRCYACVFINKSAGSAFKKNGNTKCITHRVIHNLSIEPFIFTSIKWYLVFSFFMHLNEKIFHLLKLATAKRANQHNMADKLWWYLIIIYKMSNIDYPNPLILIKVTWYDILRFCIQLVYLIQKDHPLHDTSIITVDEESVKQVAIQIGTLLYLPWLSLTGSIESKNIIK